MTITYHPEVEQGGAEWLAMRCGLITASEMKLLITPTLKVAANDKTRMHLYELMAQRITSHVEPRYISDDMLRGQEDELVARELYARRYGKVDECGFVTNDEWGFTIGYSPDGLVGDTGLIECKSRLQKHQVRTIVEIGTCPEDYAMQCQTGLLVTGREWIDLVSYSGGLPLAVIRVYPDEKVHAAILEACSSFEAQLADKLALYHRNSRDLLPTERRVEQEMFV